MNKAIYKNCQTECGKHCDIEQNRREQMRQELQDHFLKCFLQVFDSRDRKQMKNKIKI